MGFRAPKLERGDVMRAGRRNGRVHIYARPDRPIPPAPDPVRAILREDLMDQRFVQPAPIPGKPMSGMAQAPSPIVDYVVPPPTMRGLSQAVAVQAPAIMDAPVSFLKIAAYIAIVYGAAKVVGVI